MYWNAFHISYTYFHYMHNSIVLFDCTYDGCLCVCSQLCVQNSPQEARNMLLQNPQLAYALLQAQVVMRIVDPEIALVRGVRLKTRLC